MHQRQELYVLLKLKFIILRSLSLKSWEKELQRDEGSRLRRFLLLDLAHSEYRTIIIVLLRIAEWNWIIITEFCHLLSILLLLFLLRSIMSFDGAKYTYFILGGKYKYAFLRRS